MVRNSVWAWGGVRKHVQGETVCLCVSNRQGKVRDVTALLRVWLP